MTWVVGLPSMFGYAIGVSDIQVTWNRSGTTRDCLQKVFPVGSVLAAGFAGSVQLGFMLLQDMRNAFSGLAPGEAWFPRAAAQQWHRRGRRIFSKANGSLKALGCEIMLFGASPVENAGDVPWGKSYVIVMRSPEFEPEYALPNKCISIGSGSQVTPYIEHLERINREPFPLMQHEVGMPGGMGLGLTINLTQVIGENPTAGISRHLHTVLIHQNNIQIRTNDHDEYAKGGPVRQFRMPKVARNWNEFRALSVSLGLATAQASG